MVHREPYEKDLQKGNQVRSKELKREVLFHVNTNSKGMYICCGT